MDRLLEKAEELEKNIGYTFKDKRLLLEALTHSTFSYENRAGHYPCNERLEFLGDLVLGLTVGSLLFHKMPDSPEGVLTKIKSRLVCEPTLALVAEDISLSDFLIVGRGEDASGGRHKPSNLSNAVEAILGAVMEDSGFDVARDTVIRFLMPYIDLAVSGRLVYDFKTELLEKIQTKHHSSALSFRILNEEGPAHCPRFTVGIYLEDRFLAKAEGYSKKSAEQKASKIALKVLENDKCI